MAEPDIATRTICDFRTMRRSAVRWTENSLDPHSELLDNLFVDASKQSRLRGTADCSASNAAVERRPLRSPNCQPRAAFVVEVVRTYRWKLEEFLRTELRAHETMRCVRGTKQVMTDFMRQGAPESASAQQLCR